MKINNILTIAITLLMVNFPVKADDSTQYDVYISGFIYNDNDYPTATMWKNSKEIR